MKTRKEIPDAEMRKSNQTNSPVLQSPHPFVPTEKLCGTSGRMYEKM